eukprot:TRINITY_DN42998_c0_g1_i1.p1 TRINITY_DN42998_c0_g1~~TRINITY_DN42998_c0_g1_i1.p1  ORF type:complete len:254 (-),score=43.67 TRINITY_DN42998_c0_g1_i1:1786-2547(-)
MEKGDIIPVRLTGKNYMNWSFHLKNYVEGQGLLGLLDRSDPLPTADSAGTASKPADKKPITTWQQNNAKVITWILNSIDQSISLSLQAYTKASDMWNHLKKLHHQANKARRFYLDTELAKYCQVDRNVQEYYNGFLALWTMKDSMLLNTVLSDFLPHALKLKEESHVSHFLMSLRPEFESVQSALMNREISPDLDTCVQEVLREEIRLPSQHNITNEPKAFAIPTSEDIALLTSTGQKTQCFDCKGYGHLAQD